MYYNGRNSQKRCRSIISTDDLQRPTTSPVEAKTTSRVAACSSASSKRISVIGFEVL